VFRTLTLHNRPGVSAAKAFEIHPQTEECRKTKVNRLADVGVR
jgi:hypothetical protein